MKKLQVFVSSTYLDLKEERQMAVEGILRAGHIPAGMELFMATSKSQWLIIEEWIKESDILFLILGGKYGSIEPQSGKSYTQLEYEFALKHNIPVFAIVLSDQYLAIKKSKNMNLIVYERDVVNPNVEKYEDFKKSVLNNLIKYIDDINQIIGEVSFSLNDFKSKDESEYNFRGWVRNTSVAKINYKHGELYEEDKTLLKDVIDTINKDAFLDIIEYISIDCSYKLDQSKKIHNFIFNYSKPDKRFFNEELQKLFGGLLNQLEKFSAHLATNFFSKNNRQHLYPDLNIDYGPVDNEGMDRYDKHLEKLSRICKETTKEIEDFIHQSKIILYA